MKYFLIFFATILLIQTPNLLICQELDCVITINTENISSAVRDYLRTYSSDIERYMNSTRFTNEDLDGEKIQCSVDIFFKSSVGDNRYQAQAVIISQRPIYVGDQKSDRTTPILKIVDNNWEFTYMPNQRMNHDEMSFDPLTSFLDFYAYLIIGYDLETYKPMSGSQCFQKALKIVQFANGSPVAKDWQANSTGYSKYTVIDELTQIKFNPFHSAYNDYHFDGIDLLATEHKKAQENILKALSTINDVHRQNLTSMVIKLFFGAKFREIAEAFQNYPDRNIYETLSNYDEEHRKTYQEWMTKP